MDVRDVVLDGVKEPAEKQESKERREGAVPQDQGHEADDPGRQQTPMEVTQEVPPVERQPVRQLRGPEGEEPAAQVSPADHVPEALEEIGRASCRERV